MNIILIKYQKIVIFIVIFFLGIPSVSLASSFVVSLIQGKTPAEAVQVIAEQLDSLFGRVEVLETQQIKTSQDIEKTNLEIERLKLENENLHLKNENLSNEATRNLQQVIEDEKSIDLVNQCKALERPRVCTQNLIDIANKQISSPYLTPTASYDEVTSVIDKVSYLNGSWYFKSQTNEICWKFAYGNEGDRCKSRSSYIQTYNENLSRDKERAPAILKQNTEVMQPLQIKFDGLKCEALLQKYVPNRSVPGCV